MGDAGVILPAREIEWCVFETNFRRSIIKVSAALYMAGNGLSIRGFSISSRETFFLNFCCYMREN